MDGFEKENFVRVYQFESFINTVERVIKQNEAQIMTLSGNLIKTKTELDKLKDNINKLSLFQFIKLKLKRKPIC